MDRTDSAAAAPAAVKIAAILRRVQGGEAR